MKAVLDLMMDKMGLPLWVKYISQFSVRNYRVSKDLFGTVTELRPSVSPCGRLNSP